MLLRFVWPVIRKLWKLVTSRLFLIAILIIIQATLLILGLFYLNSIEFVNHCLTVLSIVMTIYILLRPDNPTYKLAWIVPILIFPVLGGVFYLMFGRIQVSKRRRNRIQSIINDTKKEHKNSDPAVLQALQNADPSAYRMANYLENRAPAPVFQGTYSQYLATGEEKFAVMLEELRKAERYIFLEYFIISDGVMWQQILQILCQKAALGVDVRIIYDDLGSISTLAVDFPRQMQRLGIQTRAFNRFRASLDVFMNHRDHRKICVIDGNVGITGGINLADEYINEVERFGHWKDSAILLKGAAVWNLTLLFLQMWEHQPKYKRIDNHHDYQPTVHYPDDGFVQPFGDSPLDYDLVGEVSYLNIIANANDYVYITTPYLILDNEMTTALITAAQSGVDVCIITPHIPDKWYIHMVTQANYTRLLAGNVKIFEYTPGFIHAKTIVSDGCVAMTGTINFDFRSFYLHFECATLLYHTQSVLQMQDDFIKTCSCSKMVTLDDCRQVHQIKRLCQNLLALFSPLM